MDLIIFYKYINILYLGINLLMKYDWESIVFSYCILLFYDIKKENIVFCIILIRFLILEFKLFMLKFGYNVSVSF